MIIDALTSEDGLRDFLELPTNVYRNDPHWIVEPIAKTKTSLLRESFAERQKAFLYRSGGSAIARVVARISATQKGDDGSPIGMLGFFEAHHAPTEVSELLATAIEWLRGQGVRTIVGPMDGDTWHRYRFNVGPFDEPPFLMEPYNKSYYAELWQQAGFAVLENYHSKIVEDSASAAGALAKIHSRLIGRGYRLRPMVMERFEAEIEVIYRLSTEIFAQNYLYEPITQEEFLDLYRPAKSLIDPELVLIAEAPSGEPVGFVFSLIDYHEAIAAMHGQSGWLAKMKFVTNRGRAQAVNIKSLGVLASHRRFGVAAALMCQSYRLVLEKGFRRANLCLIRDGNPSGRLDGELGSISRRYVLFHYPSLAP